jgi:tetratricopeptide (TPR) repeat protein
MRGSSTSGTIFGVRVQRTWIQRVLVAIGAVLACVRPCLSQVEARSGSDALALAERLAWLRNWSGAQPFYSEAQTKFETLGDRRNALFARISGIRADLQRRSLPETSDLLGALLEDPLVQSDARLRLRCLVVKGDVDLDLDTDFAQRDWTEVRGLADSLGETGWANRARGELAVVSFLQGNHEAAALGILGAIQKARQTGDIASVVRYETLVGDGLIEWKQYDKALSYFDSALEIAKSEPDIQYPLLLYSGKIGSSP